MHPTCQLQFKAISQQEAASLKYDSRQRSICQLMIQILRNKKCLTKWLSPTSCLCREAAEVSLSAYTTGQESFSPFCSLPSESVEKVDTLPHPAVKQTAPHAVYTGRHPAGQLLPAFKVSQDFLAILLTRVNSSRAANSCQNKYATVNSLVFGVNVPFSFLIIRVELS